jgi:hypothetical protein
MFFSSVLHHLIRLSLYLESGLHNTGLLKILCVLTKFPGKAICLKNVRIYDRPFINIKHAFQ